jgi:hypothetical protein
MEKRLEQVLSYAPRADRWERIRAVRRRTWIKLGAAAVACLVLLSFLRGPTSGQIRLDSGDRRYCWWGIPIRYERMAEPNRSKIVALSAMSPAIPAKWVTCVRYPLPSSNNTDLMCSDFYWSIAAWANEDPKIARWTLEDVTRYIPGMLARGGLPESCSLLSTFTVDWRSSTVKPDWREDEEVQRYCASHGYVLVPTTRGVGVR